MIITVSWYLQFWINTKSLIFSVSFESFDDTSNNLSSSSPSSSLLMFSIWFLVKSHDLELKVKVKKDNNSKRVKGLSSQLSYNLQQNDSTVLAATKLKRSTLCLVHSRSCRPGLTHAGNNPLQLQRCISGQVPGPRVSSNCPPKPYWHSSGMEQIPLNLSNHQFVVFFSFIWPIIDELHTVKEFLSEWLSSWPGKSKRSSSNISSTWLAVCLVKTEAFN